MEKCTKATTLRLDSHTSYINLPAHSQHAKSIDRHLCVCVHKPNVHSDGRAYCIKLSGHMRKQTFPSFTVKQRLPHTVIDTHTNTPRSIPALTVTDPLADKTPHASGKAWCWGPPLFSRPYPKTHTQTSHTLHSGAKATQTHTHTSHRCLKIPPPIPVPAFSFTLSLFYPSLCLFLPASLLLPSVASQPIRREVTS